MLRCSKQTSSSSSFSWHNRQATGRGPIQEDSSKIPQRRPHAHVHPQVGQQLRQLTASGEVPPIDVMITRRVPVVETATPLRTHSASAALNARALKPSLRCVRDAAVSSTEQVQVQRRASNSSKQRRPPLTLNGSGGASCRLAARSRGPWRLQCVSRDARRRSLRWRSRHSARSNAVCRLNVPCF